MTARINSQRYWIGTFAGTARAGPAIAVTTRFSPQIRKACRGVALLLILIVVAMAAALGVSILTLATVRSLASQNLVSSTQAEYLAESGLTEAVYFFSYQHVVNPSQPDAVWSGVAGRQLDGSADYYNVSVTAQADDPLFFSVLSTARIFGQTNEKFSRSLRGRFMINRGFSHGLMANQNLAVPPNITINGNVYAKGNVTNAGTITGNVQATGTITNTGTIGGKRSPGFPYLTMLSCTLPNPLTYTYQGTQYLATVITMGTLNNINWTSPPAGNPMGVYIRYGDLVFGSQVRITGTVIVTDNFKVDGTQNTVTAQPAFPAIIVQKKIHLRNVASSLTANGAVIVHDAIEPKTDLYNSYIVINGPLVFLNSGSFHDDYFKKAGPKMGSFVVNQDLSRASVSGLFPPDPAKPRQVRMLGFSED